MDMSNRSSTCVYVNEVSFANCSFVWICLIYMKKNIFYNKFFWREWDLHILRYLTCTCRYRDQSNKIIISLNLIV